MNARVKAVDAVEGLLKQHIPQYTYSEPKAAETRTDAVILADAAVSAYLEAMGATVEIRNNALGVMSQVDGRALPTMMRIKSPWKPQSQFA